MTTTELIHRALKDRQWTQRQLAKALGMPYQNLNEMLRARRPLTTRSLLLIETCLNLSLDHNQASWPES